MKAEDIRRLYKVTPKLHESIEHTLQHLDNTAVERYKRQKAVRRFIIAFAVIASVVAFSTVTYATNLFGLLTEPVGKYGIDMHIAEGETTPSTVSKRYAKPNPTYLPKGCCQLMRNDENENPILNDEGVTSYNPNGNYQYTDGNETWVHFHVYQAESYSEEARYIVDSFEKEYGGHKTVFLTRQFEDNGNQDHYAVKYFEDWGIVVDCYYDNVPELMKIMQGLELQEPEKEEKEHLEPETVEDGDDPYAGYAFLMKDETREYQLGEAFTWSEQMVDAPSPSYCFKEGECEITVKAVKENDGIKGLDKNNLLFPDNEEWCARYFNSDGSLKTLYIRTDIDYGDGVNALGHSESKEVNRHFYLATVEVKNGSFTGQFMTHSGSVLYQENHSENGAELYTIGIVADEDELNDVVLSIASFETVIDDKTQTVVRKSIDTIIPIQVNQ